MLKANIDRLFSSRNSWQTIYYIASIIISLSFISASSAEAGVVVRNISDKNVHLFNKGYSGNTLIFESKKELSVGDFDWVILSCNGYQRQMQVKNYTSDRHILKVNLYENVPCDGNAVQVKYSASRAQPQKEEKVVAKTYSKKEEKAVAKKLAPKHESEFVKNIYRQLENRRVATRVRKPERVVAKVRKTVNISPAKNNHGFSRDIYKQGPRHHMYYLGKFKADEEYSEAEIKQKIRETWPEESELAIAIGTEESGLHPYIVGDLHLLKKGSGGIFQVNMDQHAYRPEDVFNPLENIKIARKLYDESKARNGNGWLPWSAYKNGGYRKHLR